MEFKQIETAFKDHGFLEVSHTSLNKSISFSNYKAQIWNENFGGMDFLKKHLTKKDPKQQDFTSAFIATFPYFPLINELKSSLKVALYAQQKDYHFQINEKLKIISTKLQKLYPENKFSHSIDSAPILERDLAYRSGLGWVGKNTCLIDKKQGSLFYIAEILTDLPSPEKAKLQTDHCGSCTRCIDVCPTNALSPRKLDVAKCISYRNIEDRDCSPKTLDKTLESWFFGCDLCQTICPWNEKAHGKEEMATLNKAFEVTPDAIQEIKSILSRSNKQLDKDFREFPLSRARGTGLKRNALKLIHENKITELKDFLMTLEVSEQLKDLKDIVVEGL